MWQKYPKVSFPSHEQRLYLAAFCLNVQDLRSGRLQGQGEKIIKQGSLLEV